VLLMSISTLIPPCKRRSRSNAAKLRVSVAPRRCQQKQTLMIIQLMTLIFHSVQSSQPQLAQPASSPPLMMRSMAGMDSLWARSQKIPKGNLFLPQLMRTFGRMTKKVKNGEQMVIYLSMGALDRSSDMVSCHKTAEIQSLLSHLFLSNRPIVSRDTCQNKQQNEGSAVRYVASIHKGTVIYQYLETVDSATDLRLIIHSKVSRRRESRGSRLSRLAKPGRQPSQAVLPARAWPGSQGLA